MKPAPFRYFRPDSVEEALSLLVEHGDEAKPLAGGQSLIPTMNFRLAQPAVLVDINRLSELAGVERQGTGLRIGAMTRHREVEFSSEVRERAPLLAEAMPFIAHAQIRNRGTIGGSLAHADPAAELPAVMLALDASFLLRGPGGTRTVAARDFYTGLFETAMEPTELLVAIDLPASPERSGCSFREMARRHGDYALVGVAACLTLDPAGRCSQARVALLSVADSPIMAMGAAEVMRGREPDAAVIEEAAERAATGDVDPPTDIHGTTAYRRQLCRVLVARALSMAAARAAGLPWEPRRELG